MLHEFSTIPGVMEDVADVILNLKEVRLRMHVPGPRTLRVRKTGAGVVTAGDLSSEDSSIEVLNPDHRIMTTNGEADVEIEVTVGTGKGYRPAERNKSEEMAIGTIPIDSIFSPVTKVNYTVTPARVGRETDFDRLNLEVWTDGAVSPADAVAFAAKILKDQLTIFINFEEPTESLGAQRRRARADEREPVPPGRRAGAVGSIGQLPEEREHPLHRRARAEDRRRDAEDQELRTQVAQRDQGHAEVEWGSRSAWASTASRTRKDLDRSLRRAEREAPPP